MTRISPRMRRGLASRKDVTEKKMFGGFCWMLRGNMLCGVEVGRFMFRAGKRLGLPLTPSVSRALRFAIFTSERSPCRTIHARSGVPL